MSSKPKDEKNEEQEEDDDGFFGWFDRFMYGSPKRKGDDESDEDPGEQTIALVTTRPIP